jgi:hypothetical protein
MHPRVDHEATRAPHFIRQSPEVLIRRVIAAHLEPQLFRVERPSLAERVRIEVEAKPRHVGKLARQRDLQVMPRHGLVQRERR